jgi:PAS domain-containing protein
VDFVNQRWRQYTGLSLDESQGRGWQAAIHSQDLPLLEKIGSAEDGVEGRSTLLETLQVLRVTAAAARKPRFACLDCYGRDLANATLQRTSTALAIPKTATSDWGAFL